MSKPLPPALSKPMQAALSAVAAHDGYLPPDPEKMNAARASWAGKALTLFMGTTGTDKADALADLLGDLMHWADYNGADFGAELQRAATHYAEETAPGMVS